MTRPERVGGFYSFLGNVEMIPARGRWRRDGGKQRGRERIMNVLFTFFLPNSSFLFFFFLFFWESFECLLLQTITLTCATSFEIIFTPFPKKELCVVDGGFLSIDIPPSYEREGIE